MWRGESKLAVKQQPSPSTRPRDVRITERRTILIDPYLEGLIRSNGDSRGVNTREVF